MYSTDFTVPEGADLPKPSGYKLLVMMAKIPEKSKGGIITPEVARAKEDTAAIVAKVLAMGPDAYLDANKFPQGPWCSIGDLVVFRSYSGTRWDIGDREFRFVNDDSVEGVISELGMTQIARK